MQTIIWDWNGTLLNDLDLSVASINSLLQKRKLELLNHNSYKEVFAFPVKDYYAAVGFDFSKEDFAIPAREFIDLYNGKVAHCSLHSNVFDVLNHTRSKNIRQFVLSAMQENMLEQTLKEQQIFDYFEGVAGLGDHYAASKVERGEELIAKHRIDKKRTTMIGDTIHDYEVAEQLGIKCILIANGHQSKKRLQTTGATIINNLSELEQVLL